MQSASRIQQTQGLLAIAGLRRVEDRLLKLLGLLAEEFGIRKSVGVKLNIRLTHQNIAHTINTTRVTVTRLLGEFQDKGYIEIDRDRHITLLNLSALGSSLRSKQQ
ncbi:MAG: Crp/Fnr family transcriptional regulator [Prochloraceae cyanobacterium]